MKLVKTSSVGLATLLAGVLSACATIKIRNHPVCADIGRDGAACGETLTSKTWEIPRQEWDKLRFGQLCMKIDVFQDIYGGLKKLCAISKRCSVQEVKDVEKLGKKLARLSHTLKQAQAGDLSFLNGPLETQSKEDLLNEGLPELELE